MSTENVKAAFDALDKRAQGLAPEKNENQWMAPAIVGARSSAVGTPWTVSFEDGGVPSVDPINRKVLLPKTDSKLTRAVKFHEIGHLKYSPEKTPLEWAKENKVEVESLVSVEEYRVNHGMRQTFKDIIPEAYDEGLKPLAQDRAAEAALRFLKTPSGPAGNEATLISDLLGCNTGSRAEITDIYRQLENDHENDPKWPRFKTAYDTAKTLARDVERNWSDPNTAITVAKRLDTLFSRIKEAQDKADQFNQDAEEGNVTDEEAETLKKSGVNFRKRDKMDADDIIKTMTQQARRKNPNKPDTIKKKEAEAIQKHSRSYGESEGPNEGWAWLKIEKPRLTRPSKKGLSGTRMTSTGYIVRSPIRWFTDPERRIFGRKAKVDRCSVLVDCSGSMGWGDNELQEILDLLPGSWIAGYCGESYADTGTLMIWARDRRRCAGNPFPLPRGGVNQVDVPALKELAKQPGPRIWISDGQCHYDGCFNAKMQKQVAQLLSQNGIVRMEHDEFRKLFGMAERNVF